MNPGKMSAPTLYKHLRKSGVVCTKEEAAEYLANWIALYTEMLYHFDSQKDGTMRESELASNKSEDDDDVEEFDDEILYDANGKALESADREIQLYSRTNILGMVKRRGSANACCNFDFQPVAAVANKIALWMLYYNEWKRSRETGEPVRYKMCNFIHEPITWM